MKRISVKTMFLLVEAGAAVSMLALSLLLSAMTGEGRVLLAGVLLTIVGVKRTNMKEDITIHIRKRGVLA